ncbi:biotin synthase [Neorickettsia helminthoeca str. Oregon]|uniref:Biotin synthase n=1 Tax=Neorickettsia helminthoeca str. Oregon TaxID=1286528 RepID=X5H4D0_9RICK|nr:biotin synthase BioB [Neorickettsia helminthoeca]AHX11523.1 biotin synthase [Neorickettsia helminthoeca str. Oregon]
MNKIWSLDEAKEVFYLPFIELLYIAQGVHREHFAPNRIQVSALLSIKTGSCPENCSYCPQSAHYNTGLKKEPLVELDHVIDAAKKAAESGATRFCIGAAWRGPRMKDLDLVCRMISEIKKLGLETCASLGLLSPGQAESLKEAGLDFYNHNIDTSPEYYSQIITTRCFNDRLVTLENVTKAGMKICCGGIIGMGESNEDRIKMLVALSRLNPPPESIPLNKLIRISGTPLADVKEVESIDFVRVVALARIMFPKSYIRLSAGRDSMSDELQALCFMAGTNSVFYGEKLLTSSNARPDRDDRLFSKLGLLKEEKSSTSPASVEA